MLQHCKGLSKTSIFFVSSFQEWLLYLLETNLVILHRQPFVLNHHVLHLELLVHLLLPSLVLFGKLANRNHVLLNGRMQLFFEDSEHISRANKPISVTIIEHEGNEMGLSDVHCRKLLPQFFKLLEVHVRTNLEESHKPVSKAFPCQ